MIPRPAQRPDGLCSSAVTSTTTPHRPRGRLTPDALPPQPDLTYNRQENGEQVSTN